MGKTLEELNVKVGDVVAYSDGKEYTVKENKFLKANDGISNDYSRHWGDAPYFTLVTPAPKTWGEMTDEEKGALLLAVRDGKAIELPNELINDEWEWLGKFHPSYVDYNAYRIKPSEPVTKTETVWRDKVTGKMTKYIPDTGGVTKGTRTITTLDGACIKDEWVADT